MRCPTQENAYLHAALSEANFDGELLAHEDVRVVSARKGAFELIELRGSEARAVALLLRLSVAVGVLVAVLAARSSAAAAVGAPTAAQNVASAVVPAAAVANAVVVTSRAAARTRARGRRRRTARALHARLLRLERHYATGRVEYLLLLAAVLLVRRAVRRRGHRGAQLVQNWSRAICAFGAQRALL